MDLTKFYDDLKSELNQTEKPNDTHINPKLLKTQAGSLAWRNLAHKAAKKLTDDCRKHILVDIYCKIIPLDKEFVDGHHGMMKSDIDNMLDNKGMTATQYFQSSHDETKAPLVEFVLRSTDMIGKQFFEEAEEKLNEAKEKGMDIPEPIAPDNPEDDQSINNQLIDIKEDPEYKTFIDKLKEKTINKIVNDISKIITDKKEEEKMTFNSKSISDQEAAVESVVSISLDYFNKKLMKENVESTPEIRDEMMGVAIRESTINILDTVFKQPNSDIKHLIGKIRYNNGVLVNESTSNYFIEACKNCVDVNGVVDQAKKEFKDKIDSKLKASDIIDPSDDKDDDKKE